MNNNYDLGFTWADALSRGDPNKNKEIEEIINHFGGIDKVPATEQIALAILNSDTKLEYLYREIYHKQQFLLDQITADAKIKAGVESEPKLWY